MIVGVDASRVVPPRTGVGRQLEYLLRAWAEHGMPFEEVRVFSHAPVDCVPDDPRFRPEVLATPRPGLSWQVRQLRRRAGAVDVLFSPYTLPPGWRGPSVVSIFGIYEGRWRIPGWRARAHSLHYAYSAHRASAVIANSSATKADLVRHYRVRRGKIEVVLPGLYGPFTPGDRAMDQSAPAGSAAEDGGPYFLFVGKLSPRRNVPALIEAFASISSELSDHRLLLVGPNTSEVPVQALSHKLGVAASVRHVDHVGHDRLARLYRGARAFVLPTEHEGFSGTLPEAVSSGCAVITVDHAALHDGLQDGVWALPDATPSTLADAMLRLGRDDAWREELRRRALRCAAELPTMADHGRAVAGVIERVARAAESGSA